MELTAEKLANMIDYACLKPNATEEDVLRFCQIAKKYRFKAAHILPTNLPIVVRQLKDSGINIGVPVGFPFGTTFPEVKAFEAKKAVDMGAQEIDMVINIGALRSKRYKLVYEDIRGVVEAAKESIVKVILEIHYLSEEEIVKGCQISKEAGAHFVKTSTGFTPHELKVEEIRLMRRTVGPKMGVKAAGGIRDIDLCLSLIKAGANRIGTSRGDQLVEEFKEKYGEKVLLEEGEEKA